MKHLNLKNILSSLMTIAAIAVLTTACNQADLLTPEITEANVSTLSAKLAQNPNFQASMQLHQQIGNDLLKLITDNKVDVTNDDLVITSLTNLNIVNEEEFALYKTNLLNDLPELNTLSEQAFEEAFSLASNLIGKQKLIVRSCGSTYNQCEQSAFLGHYYGYTNYQTYYFQYLNCVYYYYHCV